MAQARGPPDRTGTGEGFGGRALCLYQQPLPELPYEVAVTVRLDDEAGAAGLAFCSDGEYKHYGFYPSGGKLRLTRFDGPDVFTWKVLHDQPSPYYRPGDWNTLRVRLEKGKLRAYVNDHLVVEWADELVAPGKVGLAKFRLTQAEFKNFRVGKELKAEEASAEDVTRVAGLVDKISPKGWPSSELVAALEGNSTTTVAVVRGRARLLEQQAAQLRQLAVAVHCRAVNDALAKALAGKEEDIDLFHAALLIARLDNEELDVDAYRKELERMAQEIRGGLAKDADDEARLAALQKYLFVENGFHGSRHDYYNRSNSYLNEVLDDREGLPITLSVLYMELARRLGPKVVGIGLPGHFVVHYVPPKGAQRLLDVYEGAIPLSRADAARRVREFADRELTDKDLAPSTKRAIVVRMLHNLLQVASNARDLPAMVRYLDAIVAVDPESAEDRWMRPGLQPACGARRHSQARPRLASRQKAAGNRPRPGRGTGAGGPRASATAPTTSRSRPMARPDFAGVLFRTDARDKTTEKKPPGETRAVFCVSSLSSGVGGD